MSDPAHDGARLLPWILGGIVAIVGALWAALRGAVGKSEARLEAELKHEREERERERREYRQTIDRLGSKLDAANEERLRLVGVLMRRSTNADDDFSDCPTGVRDMTALLRGQKPVDRLLRRADTAPVEEWTPTQSDAPPRAKMPSRR